MHPTEKAGWVFFKLVVIGFQEFWLYHDDDEVIRGSENDTTKTFNFMKIFRFYHYCVIFRKNVRLVIILIKYKIKFTFLNFLYLTEMHVFFVKKTLHERKKCVSFLNSALKNTNINA